jgi:hypothetical protein
MPWKPVLVFGGIAVGATTAIALVTSSMGWTVASPGWALLVPLAMWAPALGRLLWLAQLAYHAPLMAGAGYADVGGLIPSLVLFAVGDLAVTFILAAESYLAGTLWLAVLLHSFHNTISQWLFPHLFTVEAGQAWLAGEAGVLPALGYAVAGLLLYLSLRRQGTTWRTLAESRTAAS